MPAPALGRRARAARVAAVLLPHVNLLLVVVGGAALSTAARLKWDPSAYVPLRAMFPAEFRAAAAALAAAGAALLLLAHLAAAALQLPAPAARRALLLLYAAGTLALCAGELALAGWLRARLAGWLRSQEAQLLQEGWQLRRHLRPVLDFLGRWHPLPGQIQGVIEEVEMDTPVNVHLGLAAAALLGALQVAALLLALLAAAAPAHARRPPPRSLSWTSAGSGGSGGSAGGSLGGAGGAGDPEGDRVPLRAKYKNGRLVIV